MDFEPRNHKTLPLAVVQGWMQAVIMHPDGIEAGIESPDAQRHLVVGLDDCESVIAPSRNLTGLERLSIYHNAYFARLLECMRSIYPAVARTLGDEAFDSLALGYLQAYPSRSYTLDRLGHNFAQFLDETRPDRDDAGQPTEEWPDFLLELARLEWAISEVFDGPGSENQHTLGAEDLLAVDPERWPELRLVAAPSLRTMAFRFPVNDYFTELRGLPPETDVPPLPSSGPSWLALSRRDFVVRRHDLESAQYELLTALIVGQTVGTAIAAIVAAADTSVLDLLAVQLRDWFRAWTAAGFFVAVEQVSD
ncbi:MAG TPA: DNA-binding domain-containing protein [Pirellulales bacterium]|nr:DNA-binding domain-containing protein [Pirellulales bacterium]